MRYKVVFSYDGSNFYGYQVQPNLRTVQGELEKAVSFLNRKTSTLTTASGRTDKGVHALGQVAHFDLSIDIDIDKVKMGLNSNLPEDIHIIDVVKVDSNFHARYMCKSKEYFYRINIGEYNPIMRNYVYQLGKSINIEEMKKASNLLVGKHDFRSFVDSEDIRENTIRKIYNIDFKVDKDEVIVTFVGNGFMKYQVRNMVGALIQVGLGKKSVKDIEVLLESKSREKALKGAPSCGLYLNKVIYEEGLDCSLIKTLENK